ncbi:MAG TPA: hypothetical protein VLG37_03010 [Candidatus Saccharimonadales bacterium]|nr:hypothetical protein [Candidatus Saccharimonadales bacterium]
MSANPIVAPEFTPIPDIVEGGQTLNPEAYVLLSGVAKTVVQPDIEAAAETTTTEEERELELYDREMVEAAFERRASIIQGLEDSLAQDLPETAGICEREGRANLELIINFLNHPHTFELEGIEPRPDFPELYLTKGAHVVSSTPRSRRELVLKLAETVGAASRQAGATMLIVGQNLNLLSSLRSKLKDQPQFTVFYPLKSKSMMGDVVITTPYALNASLAQDDGDLYVEDFDVIIVLEEVDKPLEAASVATLESLRPGKLALSLNVGSDGKIPYDKESAWLPFVLRPDSLIHLAPNRWIPSSWPTTTNLKQACSAGRNTLLSILNAEPIKGLGIVGRKEGSKRDGTYFSDPLVQLVQERLEEVFSVQDGYSLMRDLGAEFDVEPYTAACYLQKKGLTPKEILNRKGGAPLHSYKTDEARALLAQRYGRYPKRTKGRYILADLERETNVNDSTISRHFSRPEIAEKFVSTTVKLDNGTITQEYTLSALTIARSIKRSDPVPENHTRGTALAVKYDLTLSGLVRKLRRIGYKGVIVIEQNQPHLYFPDEVDAKLQEAYGDVVEYEEGWETPRSVALDTGVASPTARKIMEGLVTDELVPRRMRKNRAKPDTHFPPQICSQAREILLNKDAPQGSMSTEGVAASRHVARARVVRAIGALGIEPNNYLTARGWFPFLTPPQIALIDTELAKNA